MIGAFQFGAFQVSGFQEAGGQGSGGIPPWLLAALLAQRRRKPAPVVVEEDDEEVEPVIARAPLRLRALPSKVPAASLAPLRQMARAHDDKAFRALVEQILEAEELLDA